MDHTLRLLQSKKGRWSREYFNIKCSSYQGLLHWAYGTHEACLRAISRLAWIGKNIWSLYVVEPTLHSDQGVGMPHRKHSEGWHTCHEPETKQKQDKIK